MMKCERVRYVRFFLLSRTSTEFAIYRVGWYLTGESIPYAIDRVCANALLMDTPVGGRVVDCLEDFPSNSESLRLDL